MVTAIDSLISLRYPLSEIAFLISELFLVYLFKSVADGNASRHGTNSTRYIGFYSIMM